MMKRLIFSGVSLIVLGLHHGCGQPNEFQAPPPPPVTVTTPEQRDVTMYAEFTGRLEARENVEIRARVRGFLETVDFEEGEVVEEGALLFTIEPERYEAERDQALAEVEKAKAELELAEITLQRSETALEKGGISEIELLDAKAKRDVAAALLNAAEVAVGETELELSYTKITAPIEGRTSRKLVSEGNLVGGGEATLLTTLVDDDPIHAYFTINERDLLIFLKDRDRPSPDTPREQRREVTLRLTDGSEHVQPVLHLAGPIFAGVLSIVIVMLGAVALGRLPVARYPEIAPPTIVVRRRTPGRRGDDRRDVATPIEQEVNGVEGMIYMTSTSSSDGTMALTVTFETAWTWTWPTCWCRTAWRWPSRGCRRRCGGWASRSRSVERHHCCWSTCSPMTASTTRSS
jgi:multidrug efflux pump subunit AcrA (membrane-fusion protein)